MNIVIDARPLWQLHYPSTKRRRIQKKNRKNPYNWVWQMTFEKPDGGYSVEMCFRGRRHPTYGIVPSQIIIDEIAEWPLKTTS